ncbi:hypothetical protein ACJH6J_13565 [Mycobacterium sp. SMC-18]|uniref:hypothetical protein n=1 Tax=unclassified Mycobacterium TaxID=2642494 RepID=UPI003877083A
MNNHSWPVKLAATVLAVSAVTTAPAVAAPKPSGATLFLCPDFGKPGSYRVTIRGVFPMTQADAEGYLIHIDDNPAKPGHMVYYLQDDDGHGHEGDSSIAYLRVPHRHSDAGGFLRAGPGGLEYQRELSVRTYDLDADGTKWYDPDRVTGEDLDEIYAAATFIDADGGARTQISQQITKDFTAPGVCDGCCS